MLALKTELGDCIGNGIVQTPIQGSELANRERGITLERQVGDRLAEVTVIVDDLIDRVTELEQLPAMGLGTHADLGQGQRIAAGRPGDADAFRALVGFLCFEGARQLVDE